MNDRFIYPEMPYQPENRWEILENRRKNAERQAVLDWAKRHGIEDQPYNVQYAHYLLREDKSE